MTDKVLLNVGVEADMLNMVDKSHDYAELTDSAESDGVEFEDDLGPAVKERHIDFLLQEELAVNPTFLRKFLRAAAQSFAATFPQGDGTNDFIEAALQPETRIKAVRVKHSVLDAYGEADLVVLYRLEGTNKHVAILIEDKIHAPFQQRQAERYKQRGQSGEAPPRRWDHHWTCLVAPKCYVRKGHGFDASVELEQIREWFASDDVGRKDFKVGVVDLAIKKASITGVKVVDPIMTAFRACYYEAFVEFFRHQLQSLRTRPPKEDYGDPWFVIWSTLLPKGAYVNHKSTAGVVDLTFPNTDAQRLKKYPNIESILETGMTIEQTHKSAAIRIVVSKIEDFRCFYDQKAIVEGAFEAVQKLIDFYTRERASLDLALANAKTTSSSTPS